MISTYFVVFNNDGPLAVALTQVQADADVATRRKADASAKLPGSNVTANYYHWHRVPLSTAPLLPLKSRAQRELLDNCLECDGLEVPKSVWSTAETLRENGLITLGSARGPGGEWRRAELTELGEVVAKLLRGGV